ncbi:MAG TPA: SDR family NAD(P)-dependent oxidoreductase [Acidimicrobiia bacterium]|nr:SDR family NAD(P)-dependent oxidoreductase [Acidimicrobiia bacterium]
MSNERPLEGKVAFVAGASRGIGAAIAEALALAGAAVAVAARTEEEGSVPGTIHGVAERIRSQEGIATAIQCDVTEEDSVSAAVQATVWEFGGLDIAVCNAGSVWLAPTLETPAARWDLVLRVNLTGTFLVTKAALPHLIERGGGSLIALTTSGVGMIERGSNAYWVSKAGVERYYAGLAHEVRDHDIAVNCLAPKKVVETEGWKAFSGGKELPPDLVEPKEHVADAAVLLAQQRPSTSGLTGTVQFSLDLLDAHRSQPR